MAFTLREAGLPDVGELGAILGKAYEKDPILPQLMPGIPQAIQDKYWADWVRNDLTKPGEKLFKIADTSTGKSVAFTKVRYPAKPADHEDDEEEESPAATNTGLLMHWFEQMELHVEGTEAERPGSAKLITCRN